MAELDKSVAKPDLDAIKRRLKDGKITESDLKVLHTLIQRTEEATKQLRAAIVE